MSWALIQLRYCSEANANHRQLLPWTWEQNSPALPPPFTHAKVGSGCTDPRVGPTAWIWGFVQQSIKLLDIKVTKIHGNSQLLQELLKKRDMNGLSINSRMGSQGSYSQLCESRVVFLFRTR